MGITKDDSAISKLKDKVVNKEKLKRAKPIITRKRLWCVLKTIEEVEHHIDGKYYSVYYENELVKHFNKAQDFKEEMTNNLRYFYSTLDSVELKDISFVKKFGCRLNYQENPELRQWKLFDHYEDAIDYLYREYSDIDGMVRKVQRLE